MGFSGSQEERQSLGSQFHSRIDLRVARIENVERHPRADKLYVESLDLGGEKRQIVSGLVPYYTEEELLGRNIILVSTLKAAKLRGVASQGMLLAAETGEVVEVIFADDVKPGTRVIIEGAAEKSLPDPEEITIDDFFAFPIDVEGFTVMVEGKPLTVGDRPLTVQEVERGKVG